MLWKLYITSKKPFSFLYDKESGGHFIRPENGSNVTGYVSYKVMNLDFVQSTISIL